MNKVPVMILLAIIVIVGIVYVAIRLDFPEKVVEYIAEILEKEEEEDLDAGNIVETTDEYDEDADIPAGGGGDSSGSDPTCRTIKLSYSLKSFQKEQICNQYQGENCIDKTVNCSIKVTNLDFDVEGEFTMQFNFIDSETEETLLSQTESASIPPRASEVLESLAYFQSPDANRELTCTFDIRATPEKEVCS